MPLDESPAAFLLPICEHEVFGSGIVHVLAIKGHDVVKHTLGFDGRAVRVKLYRLDIAIDSLVPQTTFTSLVALLIILLCGHKSKQAPLPNGRGWGWVSLIILLLSCSQRVLHQRADGHWPHPTGNGRDERALRSHLVELHVSV